MKVNKIFASFLLVVVTVSLILEYNPSDLPTGLMDPRVMQRNFSSGGPAPVSNRTEDKLLGGLLAAGFEENSCLSRYNKAVLYRKTSVHKLDPYLVSKLRSYEARHKHCGPYTKSYNKTVKQLKSGRPMDCKYVVLVPYSGLGNRIMGLASAFLFALLTDRVLLVDRGKDMADLFCDPFPETTWWLPLDFHVTAKFRKLNSKFNTSYGNMLKNKKIGKLFPPSLFLFLGHNYGDYDKLFFCDGDQTNFRQVPWLIMKTDQYFIPWLFLIPSFQDELSKLFPNKVTIFHHLGRYLFHPSNHVWGLITRYYEAYLAKADERIGIQVRIFHTGTAPLQHVIDQILECVHGNKLLPAVNRNRSIIQSENAKVKAVLVTSLTSAYSEKLKDLYMEHPTVTGDLIRILQPSREQYQHKDDAKHNMKALAEMYLLSSTDVLVTSARSTFGYVAQGLGGLKPWILYKPVHQKTPNPPCGFAMSMEPCFHYPPFYDCKTKSRINMVKIPPYVRHCEDVKRGLKVVY